MNSEDAQRFLIEWMRSPELHKSGFSSYGYDLYLINVIVDYLTSQGIKTSYNSQEVTSLSPHFYAAGWDLCRRGILRPGIKIQGAQATADGASGNGYSITPFGQSWLDESNQDDYVPTEPGRFADMLKPLKSRFGPQFYERAQEAVRCYGAHAYLACCSMCGAAAESVLLAAAIERFGAAVALKDYSTASGRSRLEKKLLGQTSNHIQREFPRFGSLLKYWRDEASHGGTSNIGDNEAFTSLAFLLRFARFVDDNWDELVPSAAACKRNEDSDG
jgi:hypothetical protein